MSCKPSSFANFEWYEDEMSEWEIKWYDRDLRVTHVSRPLEDLEEMTVEMTTQTWNICISVYNRNVSFTNKI